ncbi:MAG TPA: hypothetical protein GX526_02040 [Thermoanaerobacterales bacterium]|nr:hypothetical protein [Thermoanaerobacterales bacterium]
MAKKKSKKSKPKQKAFSTVEQPLVDKEISEEIVDNTLDNLSRKNEKKKGK